MVASVGDGGDDAYACHGDVVMMRIVFSCCPLIMPGWSLSWMSGMVASKASLRALRKGEGLTWSDDCLIENSWLMASTASVALPLESNSLIRRMKRTALSALS